MGKLYNSMTMIRIQHKEFEVGFRDDVLNRTQATLVMRIKTKPKRRSEIFKLIISKVLVILQQRTTQLLICYYLRCHIAGIIGILC